VASFVEIWLKNTFLNFVMSSRKFLPVKCHESCHENEVNSFPVRFERECRRHSSFVKVVSYTAQLVAYVSMSILKIYFSIF